MNDALSSARLAHKAGLVETPAHDDEFCSERPSLHTFLTATKNDSGKPRQTSTLLVFCQDALFKATLIERDYELQLWASGSTMLEALDQLEASLNDPEPPWRKPSTGRRRR